MVILVGYDRSNTAKSVLNVAGKQAEAFGAALHVVTCYSQKTNVKKRDMEKMTELLSQLEEIKNRYKEERISCHTHLLVNDFTPGENLIQYATENKVDQIVIGVKIRSKLEKLVFGSTAQYVILKAACPVLSVK